MNQAFIDDIKSLNLKKTKLVNIGTQVDLQIIAVNQEMLKKQEECEHTDKDEKRAVESLHPFKVCKICGKVL